MLRMNRNWNAGFDIGSSSELLVSTAVRIFKPWLTRVMDMSGLRARMEAGFSRMNDVTVIQASQVPRINGFDRTIRCRGSVLMCVKC